MGASKAGRPSVYDPEYHIQWGEKFALLGMTDEEMAAAFRIDVSTFYRWQEQHDDFCKAVTRGKEPADANVAMGLYKRATGYEYPSEKLMTVSLGGDAGSEVERHDITVHVPPDPGAALNWLKNRQPAKWRDRKELQMEDQDGNALALPVVRVTVEKD